MVENFSNSRLVVSQVERSFKAKDPRMAEYLKMVGALLAGFQQVKVSQVSRGKNSHADSLATLASFVDNFVPWIMSTKCVCSFGARSELDGPNYSIFV